MNAAAPRSAGRGFQVEDVAAIAVPSAPALRPGADRVVYVLRTLDVAADDNRTRLWVQSTVGGDARPLLAESGTADGAPAWSPDGSVLAFLRGEDDGTAQLWLCDHDGDRPRRLTALPGGAGEPVFSPDGETIAFTAAPAGEHDPAAPVVIERAGFHADGVGVVRGPRSQVHVVRLADGQVRRLTDDDRDAGTPVFSPDGAQLCYVAQPDGAAWFPLATAAYTVPVAGGAPRRVATELGAVSSVAYDGEAMLLVGQEKTGIGHECLYRYDGTGIERLAATEDRNLALGGGEFYGGPVTPLGDGRVLFAVTDNGGVPAVVLDADGTCTRRSAGPGLVFSGFCRDPRTGLVASVLIDETSYGELAVFHPDRPELPRRLTGHTAAALPGVVAVPPRRRRFAGPGGEVPAWVLHAAQTARPAPVLVDLHGGPHLSWPGVLQQANPYHQVLAAAGWVVLLPDPRGSDGYGERYFTDCVGSWGEPDAADVHACLDSLVAEGVADPERIVVIGYSYGGYLTCRLTSRSDRFAAAIVAGGICDLTSLAGTHDVAADIDELEWGASVHTDPTALDRFSPIREVTAVRTPTLLLHAEHDRRCPVSQAEQWFAALVQRGVTARLVRYPGASHQFLVDGRPSHRLDYTRRIVDWATRHAGEQAGEPGERTEMRHNADFAMRDPDARRRHLLAHPWGVLVSAPPSGLVASHVPLLLEPDQRQLSLLSHLGKPDEQRHELGDHEVLLIVEGASGYISPTWYDQGPAVPTWNFAAVHLHGRPELLDAEQNYRALAATVDALEAPLPHSFSLGQMPEYATRIAAHTVGFRLRATAVEAKAKHSQDKSAETAARVLTALRAPGPYTNPALAAEMDTSMQEVRRG